MFAVLFTSLTFILPTENSDQEGLSNIRHIFILNYAHLILP